MFFKLCACELQVVVRICGDAAASEFVHERLNRDGDVFSLGFYFLFYVVARF